MPTGDFPPPKGMRWTDAHGWVPDLPDDWGTVGGKPFEDEMLGLKADNVRLRAALRPFAASFQIGAGYNRDDFRRASEAYGEIITQQTGVDK